MRPERKWTARIVLEYTHGSKAEATVGAPENARTLRDTGEHAIALAADMLTRAGSAKTVARVQMDKHLATGTVRDERQYAFLWRDGPDVHIDRN